jgi:hypothetical protein
MTSIDYFEKRGCYELALALMRDCLQQLARDPEGLDITTEQERQWLEGHSDDGGISCEQVLETLGMERNGVMQHRFLAIARSDPAVALQMISTARIYDTLGNILRSGERVDVLGAGISSDAAWDELVACIGPAPEDRDQSPRERLGAA